MPGRKIPLVTNEIYHIYNRGNNRQATFLSSKEYERALTTLHYYVYPKLPIRLSRYLSLSECSRKLVNERISRLEKSIEIHAYCLMPNHFHILAKQLVDNGISTYMANFQNSYSKYFNKRNNRDGSLFLDQFKAVRIETDNQFLHVHRYIHLNPYTAHIAKTTSELEEYQWSSLSFFSKNIESFSFMKGFFKTTEAYRKFLFDQADYQRRLHSIAHLTHES